MLAVQYIRIINFHLHLRVQQLSKFAISVLEFFHHETCVVIAAFDLVHSVLHLSIESVLMNSIKQLLLLVLLQHLNRSLFLVLLI